MIDQKDIIERLVNAGIKPSAQRMAIVGYLADNLTHPTVDQIYTALHESYPTLSRTTVYNTVWLLAESGVVNTVVADPNTTRFDINTHEHAHCRCRECGKLFDVAMPRIITAETPEHFRVDNVSITFEGVCDECQKSKLETSQNV